jgi:hypothetical protein
MSQFRHLLAVLALAALLPCAHAMPNPADGPRFSSPTLTLSGDSTPRQPVTLDVATLKALPAVTIRDVTITGHAGMVMRKIDSVTGVKLTTLLEKSRALPTEPDNAKRLAVLATAGDDYRAVFSWQELFNNKNGDGVIVAYMINGQPIGVEEGPIALFSLNDTRTGPRHVRWLKRIELKQLAP